MSPPLAAALQRAGAWLIEPAAEAGEHPDFAAVEAPPRRPVVAVAGLGRRCGTTTVARGLGAELAARDPAGAAVVACSSPPTVSAFGGPAAGRLQRALAPVTGKCRTAGRLCLVGAEDLARLAASAVAAAPLVIDAGFGSPPALAATVADAVVIVATPSMTPALTDVVAQSLARLGPEPVVALNRADPEETWAGRVAVRLPESRAGARLALAGRDLRHGFGRALAELADLCLG